MEGQTTSHYLPYEGAYPPYDPPRKRRGCFFYGCIFSILLLVLVAALIGVGIYYAYRTINKLVDEYAEDAPGAVPVASLPEDRVDEIKVRVDNFKKELTSDRTPAPLVLTAEEINALIDTNEKLRGVIAVEIKDKTLGGQVSFPLETLGFKGKYLNGNATFDVGVAAGALVVRLETMEVKGKPVPENILASLRGQNLVRDSVKDPETLTLLKRVESIQVKDGTIVITPKPADAPPKAPEVPTPEPKAKTAEQVSETKPSPELKPTGDEPPPPK